MPSDDFKHIPDHDLERYHLGMVRDEAELAALEEHLLICGDCADRAEQSDRYVNAIRRALVQENNDSIL